MAGAPARARSGRCCARGRRWPSGRPSSPACSRSRATSPQDGLYWLYALLPVAIGFVAEQLRIVSAEQVLENREIPDAEAVGELPEAEQRSVVLAIVRREIGVMALGAVVVAVLALRAALIV